MTGFTDLFLLTRLSVGSSLHDEDLARHGLAAADMDVLVERGLAKRERLGWMLTGRGAGLRGELVTADARARVEGRRKHRVATAKAVAAGPPDGDRYRRW